MISMALKEVPPVACVRDAPQKVTDSANPEARRPRTIIRTRSDGLSGECTIQQAWNHFGSTQYGYFSELDKQLIAFYLTQKLSGNNLDIGGGWYRYYENSHVVDISPACLEYNLTPPERKHVFDLDTISDGARLPFDDHVFDSATMVSVIQYLPSPWDVVGEVGRVLKPGAELYVICVQEAGFRPLMANELRNSQAIERGFASKGYDIFTELVPFSDLLASDCRSVCVAMPDEKGVSKIRNKKERMCGAEKLNPIKALCDYTDYETSVQVSKLVQLQEYPVTKHSEELLEEIEKSTKDYSSRTGVVPFVYCSSTRPEFGMSLPGMEPKIIVSAIPLMDTDVRAHDEFHSCGFSFSISYFPPGTAEELAALLGQRDRPGRYELVRFMASIKLNAPAIEIANRIEELLSRSGHLEYLQDVRQEYANNLHFLASQNKQRRGVDELIERKKLIESDPYLIAEYDRLELDVYVPFLRNVIRPQAVATYEGLGPTERAKYEKDEIDLAYNILHAGEVPTASTIEEVRLLRAGFAEAPLQETMGELYLGVLHKLVESARKA